MFSDPFDCIKNVNMFFAGTSNLNSNRSDCSVTGTFSSNYEFVQIQLLSLLDDVIMISLW